MGKRHRSAVMGRFVKRSTAKRNPRTTVPETDDRHHHHYIDDMRCTKRTHLISVGSDRCR